jgi:hypothetical protein
MAIRKHGTADQQGVTGIEHAPITSQAAARDYDQADDAALADENTAADSAEGDD